MIIDARQAVEELGVEFISIVNVNAADLQGVGVAVFGEFQSSPDPRDPVEDWSGSPGGAPNEHVIEKITASAPLSDLRFPARSGPRPEWAPRTAEHNVAPSRRGPDHAVGLHAAVSAT